MCRFVAYLGEPIFLEQLVCQPRHSLLHQSLRAEEAHTATQGDGFGIGWYAERTEPAVYREVMPAWGDENLLTLCRSVKAGLFFAHVRAATGTSVSRHNCHPFQHGRHLFMHNGQIGGYGQLRRTLEAQLPDALFAARKGSTDSELLFLLALAHMARGVEAREAVLQVFANTSALLREAGVAQPLRFNAALADGQTLHVFRLASDGQPPSLYLGHNPSGTVVASEPLDEHPAGWVQVPSGGVVTARRGHYCIARAEDLLPSLEPA